MGLPLSDAESAYLGVAWSLKKQSVLGIGQEGGKGDAAVSARVDGLGGQAFGGRCHPPDRAERCAILSSYGLRVT